MTYKDKEKQREYQRNWLQQRRLAWIQTQGSECAKCKTTDGPWEVDHIERKTKVSSSVWSWSESRRLAELAKCQLLCFECHALKTKEENSVLRPAPEHGTHNKYSQGCRCTDCKKAHSDLAREARSLGKKW